MRWFLCPLVGCLALGLAGCGSKSPDIAIGYEYTSTVPMKTIRIAKPLKGGQSKFELVINDKTYTLEAGKPFFINSEFPEGADSFSIRGIDASEQLIASNTVAFPVGVTFMKDGISNEVVTWKPVIKKGSAVTSGWVIGLVIALSVGCAFVASFVWWRRKNEAG